MEIKEIRREIEELSLIVGSWVEDSAPSPIEQDVVLSKLSRLYEGVKFMDATSPKEVVAVAAPEVEEVSVEDDSIFAIDMNGVALVEQETEQEVEPEPEVVVEPEPEPEPEPEVVVEPAPEPIIEEEKEVVVEEVSRSSQGDNMLFDLDIIPKKSRHRRSVLMSLYDDDPKPVSPEKKEETQEQEVVAALQTPPVEVEPEVEPEIEPEAQDSALPHIAVGAFDMRGATSTLADSLAGNVETVADRLSNIAPREILSDRLVYRSFDELGINERYLLARDLFGDDPQQCRRMLATIGDFDNYDDAMIFIAENFTWNPEAAGTKLLLSVLEHKFNLS